MAIESISNNNKQNKISELRAAITRAEERGNEEKVLLLEAQLRAAEKGEKFDMDEFIVKSNSKKERPKHHVLKDMQGLTDELSNTIPEDYWTWDGIQRENLYSYENTFENFLYRLGVKTFQELVDKKAIDLHKEVKVLDLFGGAYFLDDLKNVSKIVGVRLKNIDESVTEFTKQYLKDSTDLIKLKEIIHNPKRFIIEGDLYKTKTWAEIKKNEVQRDGSGFDVMVCRPEGPFGNSRLPNIKHIKDEGTAKEEIFVSLLEKAMNMLSTEKGILFVQGPDLNTDDKILDTFWKNYVLKKQKEGYEFIFEKNNLTNYSKDFLVIRNKTS